MILLYFRIEIIKKRLKLIIQVAIKYRSIMYMQFSTANPLINVTNKVQKKNIRANKSIMNNCTINHV